MVNFGQLAAEIVSLVWGTPANYNGFRILAALLHGTLVVGVIKFCGVEQRAPPIFGRAAITLGVGPRSNFLCCGVVVDEGSATSGYQVLASGRGRTAYLKGCDSNPQAKFGFEVRSLHGLG